MNDLTIFRSKRSPKLKLKARYSSVYKGVHYFEESGKCKSYLGHGGKEYRLGHYVLSVDAAFAYDKCLKKLGIISKKQEPNFKNMRQYYNERKKEANDRGINLTLSEIQEYLTSKVNNAIAEHSRKCSRNKAVKSLGDKR